MNSAPHTQSSAATRFVAWSGLAAAAGAVLFIATIVLAGIRYPRYSHVDQMISELGGSGAPHPGIQNTGFVLFGIAVVAFAIGLMVDEGRVVVGAVLIGALGLFGTTLEGVVHCDTGCLGKTDQGAAHLASGFVGFVAGVVGLFLLARRWRTDPNRADDARITRVFGWCALIGLGLFVASGAAEATQIDGLAQRIFVAPLLAWFISIGWRRYRAQQGHRSPHPEPVSTPAPSPSS